MVQHSHVDQRQRCAQQSLRADHPDFDTGTVADRGDQRNKAVQREIHLAHATACL
jgi:hypothetical protein